MRERDSSLHDHHPTPGARFARRLRIGLLWVATALVLGMALPAPPAVANTYHGLLYGGTLSISSNDATESGGFVYGYQGWTAPPGTQFNGFAYTSGGFSSVTDGAVGGVSAGFGGDGTNNQPSILFPWTQDCSITNRGHYWTETGGGAVAGTSGAQSCVTSGNTSGWNYTNVELENTNPAVNPQVGYQTLWLTVFCQAASCPYDQGRQWGAGGATVTNLSGSFSDSYNQPSGGAAWASGVQGGYWYQTNTGGVALDLSAGDPAGVCALYGYLTGPATIVGGVVGNQGPGVVDVGGPIGQEFGYGLDPCWTGQTDQGTWTLPGGIPSGTYSANVAAANPGNYEAQGFGAGGSPTIASYPSAINIDDQAPALSWPTSQGGWTSSTSEQLDVSVGPSGVSSVTCTDNGSAVAATLVGGSTSGAGTTVWSVSTPATGVNQVACSANNGDANGALAGSASASFGVDAVIPTVLFSDGSYAQGTWIDSAQAISVSASAGPSGMYDVTCSLDGSPSVRLGTATGGIVTISGNGSHSLSCSGTSNTDLAGTASYDVNIDTEQPTLTFRVDGAAPSSAWLSGTPVVTVIGGEQGGILSGIRQISCSVNGGQPFAVSGVNAASDYTGSFELDQNGTNQISCTATTIAGTVQASPATVNVNVDNPNYSISPASLIDNGSDAYSNGPSQSKWYVTPQSVTITANSAPGGAPIASISCKGAISGSWPISNLDTDAQGGEQITVTVPAPGGVLSCTAQDSAGNVYVLGSYLFQIDDTPPTGYFVARSQWPAPNEIAIHASDNGGSGVAVVKVYGESPDVNQGQPQLVGDAQLDPASGDYVATVPDGVEPWVAGSWRFYANVVDVAGNQGEITAGADGSSEDLTLPLREYTAVSATAARVVAAQEPAISPGLAAAAALLPSLRAQLGRAAQAHLGHVAGAGHQRRGAQGAHVLTLAFGRALTLRGALRDLTHHGAPISGARVDIYQRTVGRQAYHLLGWALTNSTGGYRYRVRPGPSRALYVVFPGNSLLRPAASQLEERSKGSIELRVSSIRAGGVLVMTGTVRGGQIPRSGLGVTIDYSQLGAPGSGTLGTVRANAHGRFRFKQPFARQTRGLTYVLWAVIRRGQPGWPFAGAATPRVTRRVS